MSVLELPVLSLSLTLFGDHYRNLRFLAKFRQTFILSRSAEYYDRLLSQNFVRQLHISPDIFSTVFYRSRAVRPFPTRINSSTERSEKPGTRSTGCGLAWRSHTLGKNKN